MSNETVANEQKIQESEVFPAIFQFDLKSLIRAKSYALIELRKLELDLLKVKHNLNEKERKLILNTDFKELGLTNEKSRNSYVNNELSDCKRIFEVKKHEITCKKDDIEVLNDLIRFNELELQGE